MKDAGRTGTRALVLVSLCALAFVAVDWATSGAARSALRPALPPVVSIAGQLSRSITGVEFWKTRSALHGEILALKEELARRDISAVTIDALESENEMLRQFLGISGGGITVPITSSFSSSPYGTFTVGGGREAGIQEGDIAIVSEGFVLGIVTDVGEYSATVRAVFAPGIPSDVTVGETGFSLSGRGGGNAYAEVPREAPLTEGALVTAPFFHNRPVGVIGKIESASSSAFADVYISFPFNPHAIRFVKVVRQ